MDIQGAEAFAILGATKLLNQNPNMIMMTEFWPYGLASAGVTPASYLEMLVNLGFDLYDMDSHENRVKKQSISDLLKKHPDVSSYSNILCLRNAGRSLI